MANFLTWLLGPTYEYKSGEQVTRRSETEIENSISAQDAYGIVSVVHACGQVIAEGLALPPMSLQQITPGGRRVAYGHSLTPLLTTSPNQLQTSYELREMMGWRAATEGDSYAWINRRRSTREVLEIVPLLPHEVSRTDSPIPGQPSQYTMLGKPMLADEIWHFKGFSADTRCAFNTAQRASGAITLAAVAESFGTDLFRNRAALEGIISPEGTITLEELNRIKDSFAAKHTAAGNRGRTAFFPSAIKYQPLSATATDAQWLETRRYQIEEICRFFRVSPTKVFSTLGSQSYASVEQAHIAHDQDTDAHWHERFMQSATKNLLTDAERKAGFTIVLDNRAALRGTANERADYYGKGISQGWLTRNEARESEGYDRDLDPTADKLTPAVNLFGPASTDSASTDK